MALLGNFDNGYTKTGGNWFSRMSGYSSYIPIPLVNTALVVFFGKIGTVVDAGGWLLRGKVSSAATALATGAVGTATNAAVSLGGGLSPVYWANVGSGIMTGRTLGTHTRKLGETAVSGVTGLVGIKPQVLRSYTAGVGSIGGGVASGPGRFASQIAAERGQDANAAYNNYMSGEGGVHVNQLQSAYGRGA